MPGRRRRWTDEQLHIAVAGERSLAGVLRRLGLRAAGGNYEHVGKCMRTHALDIGHWTGRSIFADVTTPMLRKHRWL